MRPQYLRTAILAATLGGLAGCASDSSISAPTDQASLAAHRVSTGPGTWDYHVADAFFGSPDPAVATASNGDRVEVRGTGILSTHPKSATGGGTFTHTDAAGNVLGSGTWTATELLSFRSYGPSPILPQALEAGVAEIRVHLTPGGGGAGFDGVLRINCILPQVFIPGGFAEGVRLAIADVINFNETVRGPTVFVRQ